MGRIELHRLTKHYGTVTAVEDLGVTLDSGTITGFLGANGAGKSTTLRMLLGLTRPTSGRATIDGFEYADLRSPARVVGAMTDPDVFHPRRSARDSLRVLARVSRIHERRVDEVLELVGLGDAAPRRTGGFSMGMRQRLGLASALLGDPETLILDEPANGLDPAGVLWLRRLVRGLAAEGRTVLVSSHLLAELAQTVDDVMVIDRGRLIIHGSMTELFDTTASDSLEDLFFGLIQKGQP
ncbi:ABC-type multidrug transport system ATPase subunit [Kribbella sp. VKM Ac-2527]|uniref:ABC-type multidrug transport system ATPase subunit n=1 Tax=Kribbella caucasensis TaxID=2512215 RepID=A0A4R6K6P0_9ACTN|nr:ATP-binding cassette domain-containing protein [Kribbella sp. VKM Ac-2527]TDO45106.1 ABC-type multidrug transport system ATPase subunit [Kribbella sp. VKM Ac-2527]